MDATLLSQLGDPDKTLAFASVIPSLAGMFRSLSYLQSLSLLSQAVDKLPPILKVHGAPTFWRTNGTSNIAGF